jgi:excinuclease UvrABC ATPase subunit
VERDTEPGVKDPTRSLRGGAVPSWKKSLPDALTRYAASLGVDLDAPWNELPPRAREELLLGDGDLWPGIDAHQRAGEGEDDPSPPGRFEAARPCALCAGARLRPEALCVRIAGANLARQNPGRACPISIHSTTVNPHVDAPRTAKRRYRDARSGRIANRNRSPDNPG